LGGGPWDGVEFDIPKEPLPDAIAFRFLSVDMKMDPNDPLVTPMSMDKRDHHQYFLESRQLKAGVTLRVGENLPHEPEQGEDPLDLVDESLLVYIYKYTPGKRLWWEEPAQPS
jgi:hypothetical protein